MTFEPQVSYKNAYACGNCWDYSACNKRAEKDSMDFPCGDFHILVPLKVA